MHACLGRAALAAILTLSATLTAAAGENVFRFGAAYLEPAGAENISTAMQGDPPPLSTTIFVNSGIKVDGGASFTLGYERRFSDDLGLELTASHLEGGILIGRSSVETRDSTGAIVNMTPNVNSRGDMTVTPVTLALNVYLDNRDNVDVLIGPVLGMVYYDDVRIPLENMGVTKASEPAMDIEVEDDFTYGVVFAIGAPIGETWEFRGAARWMKTTADYVAMQQGETFPFQLDVDPIAYEFTFGARF